ncbi:MAG: zinc ribbon domain-containing protein [Promethearchaeota archaeon]
MTNIAYCSKCGAQLDPSWKSCPHCGQKIIAVRPTGYTCPNCRNPIHRDQVVCIHCGIQLRATSPTRPTSYVEKLAKVSYYWVFILVVIILVIAGIMFLMLSSL